MLPMGSTRAAASPSGLAAGWSAGASFGTWASIPWSSSSSATWRAGWRSPSSSSTRAANSSTSTNPQSGCLGDGSTRSDIMPFEEWTTVFVPASQGRPLDADQLPLVVALRRSTPAHSDFEIVSADGVKRSIEVTAFPVIAPVDRTIGAVAMFWERGGREGHLLGDARLSGDTRSGDHHLRWRHLLRGHHRRGPHAPHRPGRGDGHPPAGAQRLGRGQAGRHLPLAPPPRPHPRPWFLRAAVPTRLERHDLGTSVVDVAAPSTGPLPVAAPVPGPHQGPLVRASPV